MGHSVFRSQKYVVDCFVSKYLLWPEVFTPATDALPV